MIEEGNRRLYVNVNDLRKKNPARAAKYIIHLIYLFLVFIFFRYILIILSL